MSFRIENKYMISNEKSFEFYNFLNDNSASILFPKRQVLSIYFDNDEFTSYHNSIEGVVPRKKIRLRCYPEITELNQIYNLEIKINSPEGRFKQTKKNIDFKKLINFGYHDSIYGLCKPIIEVSYIREYFKIFNLRITVDKHLRYKNYNNAKTKLLPNSIIFEVKSENLNNLDFIENNIFFQKTRFSKFCNGIEELNLVH